jgi:membrane protein implicated in regulation of membrane protease activity
MPARWIFVLLAAVGLMTPSTGAAQTSQDTTALGRIKVVMPVEVDSVYVIVDGDVWNAQKVPNGVPAAVPSGREITVRLAAERRPDVMITDTFSPDETTTVRPRTKRLFRTDYLKESSYPALRAGHNVRITTGPESMISVNGDPIGHAAGTVRLSHGRHDVTVDHPEDESKTQTFEVVTQPLRLYSITVYTRPALRSTSRLLSVVPGASQIYKDQKSKGYMLASTFVVASFVSIWQHRRFGQALTDREALRDDYWTTETETRAFRLGNEIASLTRRANRVSTIRDVSLGLMGATFLYSLLDAWLDTPERGYRTPKPVQPGITPIFGRNGTGVELHLTF